MPGDSSGPAEFPDGKAPLLVTVALPRPIPGPHTYLLDPQWAHSVGPGHLVEVPLGRTRLWAYVLGVPRALDQATTAERELIRTGKLRAVLGLGDSALFLPAEILELCRWAHDYYFTSLGDMLHCAAPGLKPSSAKKPRGVPPPIESIPLRDRALTPAQTAVLEQVREYWGKWPESSAPLTPVLLEGVTGSGKTEIYIELARAALARHRGVLILVPEIALTPQTHERFSAALGVTVGLWHSAMTPARRRALTRSLQKAECGVVLGARSAVFAPVPRLGLIVVDEEHDPTYKQTERVCYHARDLAIVRAQQQQAAILLGSATPSLESDARVREGKYQRVLLSDSVAPGGLARVELVDLREAVRVPQLQAVLAECVRENLMDVLARGEQAIVYLNRRGFAAFALCPACRHVPHCHQCSVALTFYRPQTLRCHICAFETHLPLACPSCGHGSLRLIGAGTESLEAELPNVLPGARIARMDRAQVSSPQKLATLLAEFKSGQTNLLLGTQMLVKGHDFPNVTLVVVILADALFRWPDFRAAERAYQTLKQVAGRAGRGSQAGRVLVQTYDPYHPVLQTLIGKLPHAQFIDQERTLRAALHYPPFGRLCRLRITHSSRLDAIQQTQQIVEAVRESVPAVEILGPTEAWLEKIRGLYRWECLLRSPNLRTLREAAHAARRYGRQFKVQLLMDIDPYTQ